MDDKDPSPAKRAVRVAFVGPCGVGKSTIVYRLRELGVDARMPAQEHSGVPSMWQKLLNPDLLVLLDAPNEVLRERRPGIDLNDEYLAEQRRRLAHAIAHADSTFDTSHDSPDAIIAAVLAMVEGT
jgi:adenylate kinase